MRFLLLLIIRSYWILIPKNKRRKCLFKKSCSNYVYETTQVNGFIAGLKALCFRIQNCRPGYDLIIDPETGKKRMILRTGVMIDKEEIAETFGGG